jgi:hypothetical protein
MSSDKQVSIGDWAKCDFNLEFGNFGRDGPRKNLKVTLQYQLITSEDLDDTLADNVLSRWPEEVSVFHKKYLAEANERWPGKTWVLCCVSGDGNCFFHCGSAYSILTEPTQVDHHYYHRLRHLVCDELCTHIDDVQCPSQPELSMLEAFQLADITRDVEDIGGHCPPKVSVERTTRQVAAKQESELRVYKRDCQIKLNKVRSQVLGNITKSRANGTMNTGKHIMGMSMLMQKHIAVLSHDSLNDVFSCHDYFPTADHDETGLVLPLFYDSVNMHYTTAVPMEYVERYKAPPPLSPGPKNRETHDELGEVIASKKRKY